MSLEKLAKQARRDLAANPKKAAALGLMILVALYFWGPLIAKWMSAAGNKRSGNMHTASLILTDDPAEPAQQARSRGSGKLRWERIRQLMQQDSYMLSATFDPTWVDPFARSAAQIALEQSSAATSETPASATAEVENSNDIAVVLGGVFVGSKRRVATINGKTCREGETMLLTSKEDRSNVHKLRVIEILRQSVVVELNGKLQTLELASPSLAHGDEIQRQKPASD